MENFEGLIVSLSIKEKFIFNINSNFRLFLIMDESKINKPINQN